MKNSGLFLGLRLFFGALVPGCVWVGAVASFVFPSGTSLLDTVRCITVPELSLLLGISFLAGYVVQPVSYRAAVCLSSGRWLDIRLFAFLRWGQQKGGNYKGFADDVREKATAELEKRFPIANKCLATNNLQGEPELLFAFCKKIIILQSDRLGKMLDEVEGDINLLASLPLPLTVLTAALIRLFRHSPAWCGATILLGLVLVCLLLVQLREVIQGEKRTCFEMFLILTGPAHDGGSIPARTAGGHGQ